AWAGMAMLMEGSTLREGKYSDNLLKATNWLMSRAQPSGLIGNPNNPTEASRYMYGHGFGLLFLACVYGEEDDKDRRKKLEGILPRAVDFAGKAQTNRGGWGYVSALEGGNFDEGSVTITQLQGIRAAKNAGIKVPKSIIDNAVKYLHDCTTDAGGIIYSLGHGRAAIGGGGGPPPPPPPPPPLHARPAHHQRPPEGGQVLRAPPPLRPPPPPPPPAPH